MLFSVAFASRKSIRSSMETTFGPCNGENERRGKALLARDRFDNPLSFFLRKRKFMLPYVINDSFPLSAPREMID